MANHPTRMGSAPKVPEVRMHGFTAGHDEHQRTKGYEDAMGFCFLQKGDGVSGIAGSEDVRVGLDLPHAQHGQNNKPDEEQ